MIPLHFKFNLSFNDKKQIEFYNPQQSKKDISVSANVDASLIQHGKIYKIILRRHNEYFVSLSKDPLFYP
jgi:hypothetical protein